MSFASLPDSDRVIELLNETATLDILPRFRALDDGDIMEKGPDDPVTVADIASEKRLTQRLPDLLPGSVVVAEEAVARNAALLDLLHGEAPVWLIDPIGGTKTFMSGGEDFGIYVSLVVGGAAVAGWVHLPVSAKTTVAIRGEGAWEGESRLHVADAGPPSALRCYIHPNVYTYPNGHRIQEESRAFAEVVRIGSVGAAFCALAAGTVGVGVFAGMWQWDHAPGVLIHREAGGYAARRDGKPYRATDRFRSMLAAPDEDCWREIDKVLSPSE